MVSVRDVLLLGHKHAGVEGLVFKVKGILDFSGLSFFRFNL